MLTVGSVSNFSQVDMLAANVPKNYKENKELVINDINLSIFSTGSVDITCEMLTIMVDM
jgi:hypothetical protein